MAEVAISSKPDVIGALRFSRIIRACWFMAHEVGVSSIPVSEVSV